MTCSVEKVDLCIQLLARSYTKQLAETRSVSLVINDLRDLDVLSSERG